MGNWLTFVITRNNKIIGKMTYTISFEAYYFSKEEFDKQIEQFLWQQFVERHIAYGGTISNGINNFIKDAVECGYSIKHF